MTWREITDASKPPSAASSVPAEVAALATIVQATRDSPFHVPAYAATGASGSLVDPGDLIGASEVLELCGWKTRKSIGDQAGFPAPVASVSGTRIWLRTQVTAWHAQRTISKPPASPSPTSDAS